MRELTEHTAAIFSSQTAKRCTFLLRGIFALCFGLMVITNPSISTSCALDIQIGGNFNVSHPGALQVAMAVAQARNDGILPEPPTIGVSNDLKLQRILADVQQFMKHLSDGNSSERDSGSFSLLLVGPGYWSHFHPAGKGYLAQFHAQGPLPDKPVVLTHQSVLTGLLRGSLDLNDVHDLGLIKYSGRNSKEVRKAIDSALIAQFKKESFALPAVFDDASGIFHLNNNEQTRALTSHVKAEPL